MTIISDTSCISALVRIGTQIESERILFAESYKKANFVKTDFEYNSGNNNEWIVGDDILKLLSGHI